MEPTEGLERRVDGIRKHGFDLHGKSLPRCGTVVGVAPARLILHADLDAFFASVEQLDDPSLRGRPVLVGGKSSRSVVAAASYEARAFGCRSAMPMARALALCPHAHVARPRFDRYSELSERFMGILRDCTPVVEALSVDEAFMDCGGSVRLLGDGPTIADLVRRRVREDLGLAVSVGIGPNKFVAKLATDMNKPDGVTAAPGDDPPGTLARWLAPQPIERMWGVGPRTAGRFHAAGVRTFGDLQSMPEERVAATLGDHALEMRERAFGRDGRPVHVDHDRKGVGHETTFAEDLDDHEAVIEALAVLVESACRRLRGAGARTRRITVKIRTGDFETVTRSATLPEATDSTLAVLRSARELFRRWARESFEPVRLVGVRLEVASAEGEPASLFADAASERQRAVDSVADRVAERFGPGAITRAPGASTGRPSRPRSRGS